MATTKTTKNMFKQSVEAVEQKEYEQPFENQLSLSNNANEKTELEQNVEITINKNTILDSIQKKQSQKKGTNKSIYLSKEVIEALIKIAAEKDTNPSKLANDILRQVLLP